MWRASVRWLQHANQSDGCHRPLRGGRSRCGSRCWNTRSPPANKKDSYRAAQYRRLKASCGHGRASIAVCRSILAAAWHMLQTGEVYRDNGADYFTRLDPERQTRQLVGKLEALGHQVALETLPEAA